MSSTRLIIVRSLTRLKTQNDKIDTLKELGINIEPINDDLANLLEECICTMICGDDETSFDSCLSDVQDWLDREKPLKEVTNFGGTIKKNVEAVSDFVDFLFETYIK